MTPAILSEQHAVEFSLADKYALTSGTVLISGIQALVRALQTRAQLDREAGLNSGGFVSGYRGSPLGGLDKELWSQQQTLQDLGIHFQPGINEDLAATAVWGSQQVGLHAGAQVDGVFGLWYGKAPGLDRSCDAIRHANAWGTSALGGVLLVVGDDPAAKSSSLTTQSEFALQDLMVPVLAPADVQDVLDFAVLGWQMSRYSGLWIGLKALADHMDGSATVAVDTQRYQLCLPASTCNPDRHIRVADNPLAQELRLVEAKLPAALEFAAAAGINKQVTPRTSKRSRLGIIAAGKAYRDVREALAHFGLFATEDISTAGIQILKLGMTWPLDPRWISEFAQGVEQVLVVEEKRAFVEPQVKEILYTQLAAKYNTAGPPEFADGLPPVFGKQLAAHTQPGAVPGLAQTGTLAVHEIVQLLVELLALPAPELLARQAHAARQVQAAAAPARLERTPLFCAGCPHNTSTGVPTGSRATAGIGCHYMVQWMDRDTDSCTQMGGEGVTWVGEAPFTSEQHIFANLGDGTYFHSGLLAIRQAVAAKVNITYKVLYNDAVAMTGGQPMDGELSVADVVRQVRAEGASKVVVVSDDADGLRQVLATANVAVEVFDRTHLPQVQQRLREIAGTTVLVYQQTCATELRRRRKRGKVADRKPRLIINEALCDGCGDCTVQSGCVAVEPVATLQGTKRKINQTLCNKDLSCARGFCPAFVEVKGDLAAGAASGLDAAEIRDLVPLPQHAAQGLHSNILITGVGGTGIVTLSALLAVAAKLDGKQVQTLDMTGLAQKGGAVFAHVRMAEKLPHVARIADGCADVLVGCDLVSAASNEALALLSPATRVALNTHVMPTADFVLNQSSDTQLRKRLTRVDQAAGETATCDTEQVCMDLLGSTQQANLLLLGFAYQQGGIPLGLPAIEQAIQLNGVSVAENLLAFHAGRLVAHDAEVLQSLCTQAAPVMVSRDAAAAVDADQESLALSALIDFQARHLTAYADAALAMRYRKLLAEVAATEQKFKPGGEQLTRAVAHNYASVLAVKDEYEVARLHLEPSFQQQLDRQFMPGASLTYLLAPPLLGDKKRRFGGWMRGGLRLLRMMKRVRNTRLDPFRFSSERRRALYIIRHYETLLAEILAGVNLQTLPTAVALARLPEQIRGFGAVKEQQLQKALAKEQQLLMEFHQPPAPVRLFDPSQEAA